MRPSVVYPSVLNPGVVHVRFVHPGVAQPGIVHPSEAVAAVGTSLGTLLASHVVRDGEIVLLILKPSVWFIAIQCAWFAGLVMLMLTGAIATDPHSHLHEHLYVELAAFMMIGRVMWASLQWMSRLYVLTDMRILRISGVFTVDIFDCPLRKVASTRLSASNREKLLGLGSVEILPKDGWPGVWQTIDHPVQVREQIVAAINKARQGAGE